MKARVYITLKKDVLDPQGKAVMGALGSLGFDEVTDIRVGKFMEIELQGTTKQEAKERVGRMCEKLLANTVIEDYCLEID